VKGVKHWYSSIESALKGIEKKLSKGKKDQKTKDVKHLATSTEHGGNWVTIDGHHVFIKS